RSLRPCAAAFAAFAAALGFGRSFGRSGRWRFAGLVAGSCRRARRFCGFRRRLPFRPRRWRLVRLLAVGQDFGDPQQGEFLPMTALAPRVLPPALFEGDDLATARLVEHYGSDRGARDSRRTERHILAADGQHLAELDDLTRFTLDPVDLEHVFGGNPVLLAAC